MDPLSLAANIVAVVNAAGAASQAIQQLLKIQDVPDQIFQLQNEVSDSRALLAVVQQVVTESILQPLDSRTVTHIQVLLGKALVSLEQITQISNAGLIKYCKDRRELKISWKSWMSNRTKLDQHTSCLREVRKEIAETLTLLTAAEVPRVRMVLQTISLGMDGLRSQLSTLAAGLKTNQPNLNVGVIHEAVKRLEDSIPKSPRKTALDDLLQPFRQPSFPSPTLRVQTAIQRQCRPLCMCICHKQSSVSIPSWMSAIVGRLFIGYSSTPIIGGFKQKCTETNCHRNDISTLKVDYYFPTWFLQRMIRFRDQISPLDGHEISIRTPRVCGPSNPIFDICQAGNIERARMLFSEGLASPFDVDGSGTSSLAVTVIAPNSRSVEMCRLLLSQYADPEQENDRFLSPLDTLWSYLLADPTNPAYLELKEVFSSYIDPAEGLRKRRFTSLHSSVLNLSNLNLEQQLLMSTANIESKCSMGRTPLLWAVSVCNIAAVKTLLKFGADMESRDIYNHSILHRVTARSSGGSSELLGILIAGYLENYSSITKPTTTAPSETPSDLASEANSALKTLLDSQDFEGSTPLLFTMGNDFADQAQILIAHGARKEIPTKCPTQPLLQAVERNSYAALQVLLRSHVNLNAIDEVTGDQLFHWVAKFATLRTIHILTEASVCCVDIEAYNNDRLTPIQVFDKQRHIYMQEEDKASREECREAFLRLLERVRPQSPSHNCWRNGWEAEKSEKVEDDLIYIGGFEGEGDDEKEEFFDALSI